MTRGGCVTTISILHKGALKINYFRGHCIKFEQNGRFLLQKLADNHITLLCKRITGIRTIHKSVKVSVNIMVQV